MIAVVAIQNSDDFIFQTVNAPKKNLKLYNKIILRIALHFNAQF